MQNVGTPDRLIRLIVGIALVALPFIVVLAAWLYWASIIVGIVLVATAVFRFCPLYAALGLSTRAKNPA